MRDLFGLVDTVKRIYINLTTPAHSGFPRGGVLRAVYWQRAIFSDDMFLLICIKPVLAAPSSKYASSPAKVPIGKLSPKSNSLPDSRKFSPEWPCVRTIPWRRVLWGQRFNEHF